MNWSILRRKMNTAWKRYNPAAVSKFWIYTAYEMTSFIGDRIRRRQYHIIPTSEFTRYKSSDVIFIFGAGSSLKEVTPDEWARIDRCNTFGWRLFVFQDYVHADFMMIREVVGIWAKYKIWHLIAELKRLMRQMLSNPKFENCLILVQEGKKALGGNTFFAYGIAPRNYTYMRFFNGRRDSDAPPTESFEEGISHVYGTLTDAINIAYLGGWKHIVLIGVDLYDSAYFVVEPGQQNPRWVSGHPDPASANSTTKSGIVGKIGEWAAWLEKRGVHLSVYNPRSLLTEVIPVFTWESVDNAE